MERIVFIYSGIPLLCPVALNCKSPKTKSIPSPFAGLYFSHFSFYSSLILFVVYTYDRLLVSRSVPRPNSRLGLYGFLIPTFHSRGHKTGVQAISAALNAHANLNGRAQSPYGSNVSDFPSSSISTLCLRFQATNSYSLTAKRFRQTTHTIDTRLG